ncbi:hypothetical protein AOQ73_06045 [Bradyrhizobium pachyrhizi]|uniref:hypothetical protein n=1 Tax=Bradyrhizobium pachyrhizi TaxID=280333 RepID=UPI000713DF63|nr:hypothetical protein [Bradyrhizobium pachyrhizi]KRQ11814.1 hypothetical protein AOQ73_06045 [Bradyrhizobium pachyrhizi]
MTEVVHLKSEDMKFSQFFRNAGGHMSQCRPITPEIGQTLAATIATYDGCSIEWTTKYEQAAIVLEGILRIRTGESYDHVIEAKVGDVLWFQRGARLKYEGDKAKAFFVVQPGDWRISSATAVVDAAAKHFRDKPGHDEFVSATRVDSWTAYEVKCFLDLVLAESGNSKLCVNGLRMAPKWFVAVGATGEPARGGAYDEVPVTVVSGENIEIAFRPA